MTPEPTSPPRLSRPGAAQGLSFLVLRTDSASSCGAQFFISEAFTNSENREAAGDRWVRSVSVTVQDCEEVERELLRLGRKSRRGCEGGMHTLLVCTPSAL